MKKVLDIAVIGAGMAGAAAARRLSDAGARVMIFDKSRGIGGRMATRRMEAGAFDHGAQFMRAKGDRFAARIAEWSAVGIVDLWDEDRYVGVPTMNAPVKALIGEIPVVSGFTATTIARDGSRWRIGGGAEAASEPFDIVLGAIPSPQAQPLLASASWSPEGLTETRYAPCWSAMFGYQTPIEIEDYVALDDDASPGSRITARSRSGRSTGPASSSTPRPNGRRRISNWRRTRCSPCSSCALPASPA